MKKKTPEQYAHNALRVRWALQGWQCQLWRGDHWANIGPLCFHMNKRMGNRVRKVRRIAS